MKIISLKKFAGIDISLNESTGEISFGDKLNTIIPGVRRISEAEPYYIDSSSSDKNMLLYLMYRNVGKREDSINIKNCGLRYDITVILPGTIGEEYIKTIGHVHPLSPLSGFKRTFTEVYSVIYGNAIYVLQKFSHPYLSGKESESTKIIEDVVIIEAKAGDTIFIPSHYGHTTINTGKTPLVMANILYANFNSMYEPYKIFKGASYYITKSNENILINENHMYFNTPRPRFLDAKDFTPKNLDNNNPLYLQFLEKLEELDYLYS